MQYQLFHETLDTVIGTLRVYKLRSALTLTGIIVGTSVVITVSAVLTGFARRVAAVSERSAPNVVYFTRQDRIGPSFKQPSAEERQRKELTYEDALAVAALDSPLGVSPQKTRGSYGPSADQPIVTTRGREAIRPLILGVWDNFPDIVAVRVEQGRFFSEAERRTRSHVAVIGSGIARQLFESDDPLGQEARIDGRVFRIIGVLAPAAGDGVLGSDELDERMIYAPFETVANIYPNIKDTGIVIRAPSDRMDEVTDEVTYLLRRRRNVPLNALNNFGTNRAAQVFDAVNQIIAGLAAVVFPVALASLAVGGVGVMNIMLVAVTERASEIGLRRALGARRRDILIQFLSEAMILTGAGGLIGIAVGFLFAFALRMIVGFPAAVPLWAILVGFLMPATIGLIAGMWPAVRAARLDPVAAMRRE